MDSLTRLKDSTKSSQEREAHSPELLPLYDLQFLFIYSRGKRESQEREADSPELLPLYSLTVTYLAYSFNPRDSRKEEREFTVRESIQGQERREGKAPEPICPSLDRHLLSQGRPILLSGGKAASLNHLTVELLTQEPLLVELLSCFHS